VDYDISSLKLVKSIRNQQVAEGESVSPITKTIKANWWEFSD
jgi:hypothetical protein